MVITRDELINAVTTRMGEAPDDDGIQLIENITDTLADYENRISAYGNWEHEREELTQRIADTDRQWRQKYTERFTMGNTQNSDTLNDAINGNEMTGNDIYNADNITIDDLFEVKK